MLSDEQKQEIAASRADWAETRRAVSPGAEALMHEAKPVLGSGFVRLIDYMGGDAAIVQGARVSYGKGTRSVSDDRGLIRYLMRNRHTSPFELAVAKFHVRAPIFVTRQWFRHRTASINEYSARYSVLDREFYIPAPESIAEQSVSNKQGRGAALTAEQAQRVLDILRDDAARCYDHYLEMLNADEDGAPLDPSRPGLARELARINLPVNVMTQFYWQINLWNLLHFLKLRADPHAQYEIRVYADAMLAMVEQWAPLTFEAFKDYMQDAVLLSGPALRALRRVLSGEAVDLESAGLSKRESAELREALPELAARAPG
ncbi:MAG: FAD-dependent thymidylate synthase [Rhodobacteraceae bacterium]|nr:MAG: FAD-dependent thymidylate synthase [Paracoccaceae bacterium]